MATLTTANLLHHHHHHQPQQPHDRFARPSNMDSSVESSIDSNDIDSSNLDNESCCSDDTVLSVGNEHNPILDVDGGGVREDDDDDEIEEEEESSSLSFKNIESHLNAISKITNSTLDPDLKSSSSSSPTSSPTAINRRSTNNDSPSSVKTIDSSSLVLGHYGGIETPCSPASNHQRFPSNNHHRSSPVHEDDNVASRIAGSSPRPQQQQQQQHHHLQQDFYYQPNGGTAVTKSTNGNESNTSNGNLKFSIDNILKADFGRRITEPINIRKPSRSKKQQQAAIESGNKVTGNDETSPLSINASVGNSGGGIGPVDLSKSDDKNVGASGKTSTPASSATTTTESSGNQPMLWPAWVYCTRYSDRPSSGPRTRRVKKPTPKTGPQPTPEEKRPRTAFSGAQLARLKHEFAENRYLTERRRQQLSAELGLNEAQIKIWFQNKRAKIKKASGQKNPLALQLMAQGLYNHSTIPLTKEEEELQELHSKNASNSSSGASSS